MTVNIKFGWIQRSNGIVVYVDYVSLLCFLHLNVFDSIGFVARDIF
jgi:hypothetical protein